MPICKRVALCMYIPVNHRSSTGLVNRASSCSSVLQATCVAKGIVLRISFGNFIFFAAHFICLLGVARDENWRRILHTGLLPLQFVAWLGVIVACFAVPNHVFSVYGQVLILHVRA